MQMPASEMRETPMLRQPGKSVAGFPPPRSWLVHPDQIHVLAILFTSSSACVTSFFSDSFNWPVVDGRTEPGSDFCTGTSPCGGPDRETAEFGSCLSQHKASQAKNERKHQRGETNMHFGNPLTK